MRIDKSTYTLQKPMRFLVLLLTGLTLLMQGCASSPDKESAELEPLYFPPPPDEPRFVYERTVQALSLIHISEPTRQLMSSRMPSSA